MEDNEGSMPFLSVNEFIQFPDPEFSHKGIVAYGGNLSPGVLRSAYLQGIFPWYSEGEPILWWSPDPRFVLFPEELHVPSRLKRFMKNCPFTFTMDKCFENVITECALVKRNGQNSTWILPEIIEAYKEFYYAGYAHSFEAWKDGELAGGFYGVLIGRVFFGESMFCRISEASKCALCHFVPIFQQAGGKLIDSQVYTDNIARFGGRNISRTAFLRYEDSFLTGNLETPLKDFYK